jgi:UDP-N-acetylmuramoyl-L-alanyl-D-glutamate--2,6-diaminopimelate ligase
MNPRSIVKKFIPTQLFKKVEPIGHLVEAMIEQTLYGKPAKNLKIIGVTGTDGKTSTSTLISHLLRHNGYKVAMMTTISVDYGDGKGEQPNPSRLTTVGSLDLTRKLKRIKENNVDWLVLETTSQALAQHRVWGIPYSIAVMTNVNHEHLDYHGTFERYRDAKRMLFKQTNRNRRGYMVGIINAEDPSAKLFAKDIKNPLTYGTKNADLEAKDIKMSTSGSKYMAHIGEDKYEIICNLPGSFNVYNSLAAVAVGRIIGLDKKSIEDGIAELKAVEGRMTIVDEGQNFEVIVDYAHTPESFEKIFNEVKPLVKNRLIAVFGSAGRRDEEKRAQQGKIAGQFCDIVIATEEDDRDMNGQEILNQIAEGAESTGKQMGRNLLLIHDREEAIISVINMAQKGDVIVFLGKGHEKSILSNGPDASRLRHLPQDDSDPKRVQKKDFDEVKLVRKALKNIQKTK